MKARRVTTKNLLPTTPNLIVLMRVTSGNPSAAEEWRLELKRFDPKRAYYGRPKKPNDLDVVPLLPKESC